MALNATSAFAGTNVTNILSLIVLGFETVQKGLLHTIPNKYDKIYMPRLNTAADQLTDRVAEPTVSATSVYDEKVIDPKDIMWYQEFNPQVFESVWADFWPRNPMVDQILDPKIQAALTRTVRGSINTQLDKLVWQGDVAAGGGNPLRFFDGFLKTMAADGDVVKVTTPAAPISATNIKEALDNMIKAMPPAVTNNKRPKFIMSHTNFRYFEDYTTQLDFKGNQIYDGTQLRYKGFQIVPVGGMTDANIVFAVADLSAMSNLFAGTWMQSDINNFKIARKQANSELWFLKALFRYGVQYGHGEEIVLGTFATP